jgi:hypothetical protein
MSERLAIAVGAALIFGVASSDLATRAFASNNYDSPDWAPIYSGPSVGREPRVGVYRDNADRYVRAPRWQLSHKTDRPR